MDRKIKKLLSFTMACVLCLGILAGCDQGTPPETEPSTVPEESKITAEERGYYLAEDYIADPSLFVPSWADEWQPPKEMLDFEEKYNSFFTPNGRMMSIAHRGDRNILYPENSIEGILSVIMAGADIVEIDVILTKDGIPVAFHDEDLLRTTNLTLMRLNGLADDLPKSNKIGDWTLEELRKLRLTMESGDGTNYVIPTLRDVFMICEGRCMVYLDKVKRIDWIRDIVPIIEDLECYRTVIIPYTYVPGIANKYNQRLKNASGYNTPYAAQAGASTIADVTAGLDKYDLCKAVRLGEYLPGDPAYRAPYAAYVGKYRIVCETLTRANDNATVWQEMYDNGFNTVMGNVDPYGLMKFIAQLHFGG